MPFGPCKETEQSMSRKRTMLLNAMAFAFCACSSTLGIQKATGVTMDIQMENNEFAVGEPIAFVLRFRNPSGAAEAVSLGGEGIGNLHIELSDDRTTRACCPPVRGGVVMEFDAVPIPSCPFLQGVLLDDFTEGNLPPGKYGMTVSVVEQPWLEQIPPPENTEWVLPKPASAEFRVVAASDEARPAMERRFRRWLKLASGGLRSEAWPSWTARRAVLLSHHPMAWKVQEAWIRTEAWEDFEELHALAESLLDSGRDGMVRLLVSRVLENPHVDKALRGEVLYLLRLRGALDWKDERGALLSPWMDEMRQAAPLSYSD